jgi:DNA-binding protein YbaB
MTQLTPEHFELHSMNKAKKFESDKKSLDNEIKDLNFAISRLDLIKVELQGNIEIVYINRLNGILDKFVDVLSNLRTKNAKQMIKKGYIEKESDLVNLHLQIKKDKK